MLKVKKDGVWVDAISGISNVDTLDGKHASDFVLARDFTALQAQVGNTSVAEQIAQATEPFIMTVNYNEEEAYSANKTFAEVFAAGYNAIAVLHYENGNNTIFHVYCIDETSVCFQSDMLGTTSAYMVIYNDDTVELSEIRYGGLPIVTTNDDGSFLRVVNGKWASVNVANAEEVSF